MQYEICLLVSYILDTGSGNDINPRASTVYALTQSFSQGEVIDFDDAVLNMGGAFDFGTSTYTCQESGTYAIYVAVRSAEGRYAVADILLDDQLVVTVAPDNTPSVQTAALAVIPCSSGSEIKLAGKFSTLYELVGSESSRTSTLTAFLIGKLI